MHGTAISAYWCVACLALLTSACGGLQAQNPPDQSTPAATQDQNPVKFRVKSNLVVVRVVVRDARGKPVEGLKKEDFKLFDQGKEQSIAQFEAVETTASVSGSPASPVVEGALPSAGAVSPSAPVVPMPGRFLALYFDDLNTSDADMTRVRDAADRYLAANLGPRDRVGIFTSEKMLSDFTNDPKQLHDALWRVHGSAHSLLKDAACPSLTDYQAFEITQFANDTSTDAWQVAIDDATRRGCMGLGDPVEAADQAAIGYPEILELAHRMVTQSQMQAQSNLQELEQVVTYTSQMPGPRTIILVTPGFLSQSEQPELDKIIDHALRRQVVISALDARGLVVLMSWLDAERQSFPSPLAVGASERTDSARELAATNVMAELAHGTGGEFVHSNNDLQAGFGALAGSPVYYILAFAPTDAFGGKFHALKVTLAQKEKGVSIQTRRGYFAPKDEAEAVAEAKQHDVSEAEAQSQEQIREAIFSNAVVRQLPVKLYAQRTMNVGQIRHISFTTHLDTKPLRLRKNQDHNVNTVIFMLAIFDGRQHLIASQQRRALIQVPDSQLQSFLKTGVDAEMTFDLKPGLYTVREVVTEAEDHNMAAFSHEVTIP